MVNENAQKCTCFTHRVCAVVGSHSGEVVRVNAADGSEVWRALLPDRVEGSAVLAGMWLVVGMLFWGWY